jgi:hypothetical protein
VAVVVVLEIKKVFLYTRYLTASVLACHPICTLDWVIHEEESDIGLAGAEVSIVTVIPFDDHEMAHVVGFVCCPVSV